MTHASPACATTAMDARPTAIVRMDDDHVAGVDAALGGWIAVVLAGGRFERAELFADFAAVLEGLAEVAVVGVDVPIGLPREGRRRADEAARAFIGVRRSSVFYAPPTGSFDATDYAAARLNHPGLSAQTWALKRAILDVERFTDDPRVYEVHPEVSFCALQGNELSFSKRSWNGIQLRLKLLHDASIDFPAELDAGKAPADDLIDAAAVAWTARRIAAGEANTLPTNPGPGEPTITY